MKDFKVGDKVRLSNHDGAQNLYQIATVMKPFDGCNVILDVDYHKVSHRASELEGLFECHNSCLELVNGFVPIENPKVGDEIIAISFDYSFLNEEGKILKITKVSKDYIHIQDIWAYSLEELKSNVLIRPYQPPIITHSIQIQHTSSLSNWAEALNKSNATICDYEKVIEELKKVGKPEVKAEKFSILKWLVG